MVVILDLAFASAAVVWRLLGTVLTLATERALVLAIMKTVPIEGTGADYDILNRVVGSSTKTSAFFTYVAKLFSRRKDVDLSLRILQPTFLRLALITCAIFAPVIVSLFFDGALSEFRACSLPQKFRKFGGALEQTQVEDLCGTSLTACSGFQAVNYTFVGCNGFTNFTVQNSWFIACDNAYNYTFYPSDLSAKDNQTLSSVQGSLELMPLNFYYELLIFRNGSREFSMDLGSPRRIPAGKSKQGLAWVQPSITPDGGGISDVIVGVPLVSSGWRSPDVQKTVYRTEIGCVDTGVSAAIRRGFERTYVQHAFSKETLKFSGPPDFFDPLQLAALQFRNWTLSQGNWTRGDEFWTANSSNVVSSSVSGTFALDVGIPMLTADHNSSDLGYLSFVRNCTRSVESQTSPLLFDDARNCFYVTLFRNTFTSIVPPAPSRYVEAFQFVCASRFSVGIQKGSLSRLKGDIQWESAAPAPSYLTYRQASQYQASGAFGVVQFTPLIEFNLTSVAPSASALPTGAALSTQKNFHPIPQRTELLNPSVGYVAPTASFIRDIVGSSLYSLAGDPLIGRGFIGDSELPTDLSNVTSALANLIASSTASTMVNSLGISPYRDDAVALSVIELDDRNQGTCVEKPVLTGILVFTVLPLLGSYIALLVGARPMLRNSWRKLRAISGLSAFVSFVREGDQIHWQPPPPDLNTKPESYRQWIASAETLMVQFVPKVSPPVDVEVSWYKRAPRGDMHLVVRL
ncbi:hypothetical protein BJ742DRAFT_819509, partial [Cladochytrium replicatum]